MESEVLAYLIAFSAGGSFVGVVGFVIAKMIERAGVVKIKELNCKIRKLEGENKVALKYGCDALDERNEALIMLSNKLSDDIRQSRN